MLIEALVLDCDDGLEEHRRNLVGGDENPTLGAAQRREDRVVVVGVDVSVDLARNVAGVAARDLARDRRDHPRREGGTREKREDQEYQEEPELANPVPATVRGVFRALAAEQAADSSFVRRRY